MDTWALIAQLGHDHQVVRTAAAVRLVHAGAAAVEPLMTALCEANENPPAGRYPYRLANEIEAVLHAIGEPAFEPLTRAVAEAETWSQVIRLGSALTGLRVPDPARYLPLLRHPSSAVRNRATLVFENLGPDAVPYLAEVLPLLADPDDGVQVRAAAALEKMGPAAVPALRELRRSPAPLRRLALQGLCEVGGWPALDAADQDLVRRLIRIKIRHETPEPMTLCGHWYAVPTGDQAAVLDALGLADSMPVTMRLGEAAWHADHHGPGGGPGTLVYVTPVWDGWTLIFGYYPDESEYGWRDALARLSRRFGEAHWYYVFEGCTGWGIAERGEIVRCYDSEEPDEQVGPPHPAERDADDWAPDVAGRASVDPESIGAHTRVAGHGVLAVTELGRRVGTPRGVPPV